MPCNDGGFSESSYLRASVHKAEEDAKRAARQAAEAVNKVEELNKKVAGADRLTKENEYLKTRLDEVTAHLCYALRAVRKFAPDVEKEVVEMNPLLGKWWEAHQKWDLERDGR